MFTTFLLIFAEQSTKQPIISYSYCILHVYCTLMCTPCCACVLQVVAVGGLGNIVRVLTDRKHV